MSVWQKTKACFKGLTTVLVFFTSIAGLYGIRSFFLAKHQFEQERQIAQQEEAERFVNLIGSLELEIEVNLDVCKNLLRDKQDYLRAHTAPHNFFHYFK